MKETLSEVIDNLNYYRDLQDRYGQSFAPLVEETKQELQELESSPVETTLQPPTTK